MFHELEKDKVKLDGVQRTERAKQEPYVIGQKVVVFIDRVLTTGTIEGKRLNIVAGVPDMLIYTIRDVHDALYVIDESCIVRATNRTTMNTLEEFFFEQK